MNTRVASYFIHLAFIFLSVPACANGNDKKLTLRADIIDDVLAAELTNESSDSLFLTDSYQSIDPARMPGFFLEITDQAGLKKKFCGMIDQGHPKQVILKPHGKLLFKIDMWVVRESHCLVAGNAYRLVVKYVEGNLNFSIKNEIHSDTLNFSIDG